jgi:integrase/recombinase XerD
MMATSFPSLLQRFFTDRLRQQRQASPHTMAGYRDTFRLLLRFAAERLRRAPSALTVEDFTPAFVSDFLDHLERVRGNSNRTRNARLAAIHSFAQYVALNEPAHALLCQRLLAIPNRRYERTVVQFLTAAEMDALLAMPDASTWIGRRDRTLLLVAFQTGLRVSELIGLTRADIVLGPGPYLRCLGKGRKHRCTPLRRDAVAALEAWLRAQPGAPTDPLFPSIRGQSLSRDAVERLVTRYAAAASTRCGRGDWIRTSDPLRPRQDMAPVWSCATPTPVQPSCTADSTGNPARASSSMRRERMTVCAERARGLERSARTRTRRIRQPVP